MNRSPRRNSSSPSAPARFREGPLSITPSRITAPRGLSPSIFSFLVVRRIRSRFSTACCASSAAWSVNIRPLLVQILLQEVHHEIPFVESPREFETGRSLPQTGGVPARPPLAQHHL